VLAAFAPATAERAQISASRRKLSDKPWSSTPPVAHSSAVSASNDWSHRLDSNRPARPRLSNPHSACGITLRPLSAVSSLGGFRTPAPMCAAPPSWSRHPKPFTAPEELRLSVSSPLYPEERSSSGHDGSSARGQQATIGGAHSITSAAPDEVPIEESVLTRGKEFFDPECSELIEQEYVNNSFAPREVLHE